MSLILAQLSQGTKITLVTKVGSRSRMELQPDVTIVTALGIVTRNSLSAGFESEAVYQLSILNVRHVLRNFIQKQNPP